MLPEQKKKPRKHRVFKALMAEAVGFEPTCPCGQLHFECSSLQPLRYASMYKYSLSGTNHTISSAAPSTTRTTLRVYFRPVFFPEICSKIRWRENRRDGKKYSILRFSVLRNIKENQGDEIPSFCRNFECSSLQPLRYASMHKYSLLGTNHTISSQPCYDHFDAAAYESFDPPIIPQIFPPCNRYCRIFFSAAA